MLQLPCNIRVTYFLAHLFFCALFILPSAHANAQVNIAVVDVERILSESDAAKSVQKQIDLKRKTFLDDVKKAEEKLRKQQKAIEGKRSKLSKEDLVKEAQKFEKERVKARAAIQSEKNKIEKAYTSAMSTITKTIFDVCQEIADKDNIDLIITRQNIIVGSRSLDITEKVMKLMNKKLPNLNVNVE